MAKKRPELSLKLDKSVRRTISEIPPTQKDTKTKLTPQSNRELTPVLTAAGSDKYLSIHEPNQNFSIWEGCIGKRNRRKKVLSEKRNSPIEKEKNSLVEPKN